MVKKVADRLLAGRDYLASDLLTLRLFQLIRHCLSRLAIERTAHPLASLVPNFYLGRPAAIFSLVDSAFPASAPPSFLFLFHNYSFPFRAISLTAISMTAVALSP